VKACTERGLGFNQSRFHHVVRVLQRLDLQRLRSITAFPACYGPVHLSISGKLANPGTFLRVPPGSARDRTLRRVAHVICFASLIGLPCSLVRGDLVEVCPLSRGVILRVCSTPIPSITEEPSLFPRSCTHTSIGFPCGSLSRCRERYGFAMFRFHARVG